MDVHKELCECFVDWKKAFDCKMNQINADHKGNELVSTG
jgi:hypothetical protein